MTDTPFVVGSNGTIVLENPETDNHASFIFGNSLECDLVVEKNSAKGQTVVICGAGPTLRDTAAKWCPKGDQVWGCNSAAIWLYENGHKVTHAFTVDQTPMMLAEWVTAPPLEYLLASSVHPHLTELLLSKGRTIRWFHNYVGLKGAPVAYAVCADCNWMGDETKGPCPRCGSTRVDSQSTTYEEWLYSAIFPETVVTGSGLNATTRAIDLALFMGFKKIILLGADCALRVSAPQPDAPVGSPEHLAWLRESTEMHADGGSALASGQSHLVFTGTIDGRLWASKPDLAVTAVWLVRMKRQLGSRLAIMGDTLPKAIMHKPESFLRRLPKLERKDGTPLAYALPHYLLDSA